MDSKDISKTNKEKQILYAIKLLCYNYNSIIELVKNSCVLGIKAKEYDLFLHCPIGLYIIEYYLKIGDSIKEIQKTFLNIWLREIAFDEMGWKEDFGDYGTEEERKKLLKDVYIPRYIERQKRKKRLKKQLS